jgi:hypothetical protein
VADPEYTTERHDLRQALEELTEAGYDVTLPQRDGGAFRARIARGGREHVEGMGATADEAFAAALERLESEGR